PFVGAMAGKGTTAAGMQRTAIETCIAPGLAANVLLAGEARFESKLHRPPARTGASRGGPLLFLDPLARREYVPAKEMGSSVLRILLTASPGRTDHR
ncbi:MAG: hypothetical protein ACREYF_11410, partial [Gammaproteobacteria bacterium]